MTPLTLGNLYCKALRVSRNHIKQELKQKGIRLSSFKASEITQLANQFAGASLERPRMATGATNRTESVEFLSILLENQVFAEIHPPAEGCDESRKHQRKCVSICSVCWRDRKRDRPRRP